jgi:hypothetical protein
MIEILIEYPLDKDYDLTITMIHGDIPVVRIVFEGGWLIERKFIKYATRYYKFSTYEFPGMKLCRYGWCRDHTLVGPVAVCELGLWKVVIIGSKGDREHDINFNNFGPVWVEMLEDYQQMKIDVKRLNSQK